MLPWKRAAILSWIVLAAGCGQEKPLPEGPDLDEIQRLSTPSDNSPPPGWSVRLEPLEATPGETCRFGAGEHILLASDGVGARARMRGEERRLTLSGPIGPTGGFFEDRQISISVGRVASTGASVQGPAQQARLTITNRRTGEEGRIGGIWTCEAGPTGEIGEGE